MRTKAIIFDFDGVIHDTLEFHREKIREFADIDLAPQEFRAMLCGGNFFQSVPEEIRNVDWRGYTDFIRSEQSALKVESEIKEILLALGKRYDLFIVSSGGTGNISGYLGNNGLAGIFKEVLGWEFHKSKTEKFRHVLCKYGLAFEECVFVTDTLGDILEANEAGIRTVAVDFGYHDRETLEKGSPWKIISSLEGLTKIGARDDLKS